MTSSADDKWSHFDLKMGIEELERRIRQLKHLSTNAWETEQSVKQMQHTIEFIEYSMRKKTVKENNMRSLLYIIPAGLFAVFGSYCMGRAGPQYHHAPHKLTWATSNAEKLASVYGLTPESVGEPVLLFEIK